jgi:hypothetical protein
MFLDPPSNLSEQGHMPLSCDPCNSMSIPSLPESLQWDTIIHAPLSLVLIIAQAKKGFHGSPSNTALQAIIWDEDRKSGKKIPPCSGTRLRIESEALRPFLYCFVSYDFCEPTHKQQQQSNHLRETCKKQSSTYGKINKGEKPKSSDWCLIKLKPLI